MQNRMLLLGSAVTVAMGALSLYSSPCYAQVAPPAAETAPPPAAPVAPPAPATPVAPVVQPPVTQHSDAEHAADRVVEYGQVAKGFVLRASIGGRVGLVDTGIGGILATGNDLEMGLFLGGKNGRVIGGVGMEFTNFTGNNNSVSSVIFAPEVMIALARSSDHRVELVADLSLGFGVYLPSGAGGRNKSFQMTYHLAPGVRFWAHRHFAIQGLAGFAGLAIFPPSDSGSSAKPESIHGVYAGVGLLGAI